MFMRRFSTIENDPKSKTEISTVEKKDYSRNIKDLKRAL